MRHLVNGREADVAPDGATVERCGDRLVVRAGGEAKTALAVRDGDDVLASVGGRTFRVARAGGSRKAAEDDEHELRAAMPGLVVEVLAVPGQRFEAGERLAVLEAMKTLQPVTARSAGVVAEVAVAAGDQVAAGQLLVRVEPAPSVP